MQSVVQPAKNALRCRHPASHSGDTRATARLAGIAESIAATTSPRWPTFGANTAYASPATTTIRVRRTPHVSVARTESTSVECSVGRSDIPDVLGSAGALLNARVP